MKKYSILTCFCMWAGILATQIPATPKVNIAQPLIFSIASFETASWQGPLLIDIEMIVGDSIRLDDSLLHDSLGFGWTCNGFNLHDSTYTAGDTLTQTISIDFDTTALPYSYVEVVLDQKFTHHGSDETATGRCYIYFTPWRSIEVWSQGDFGGLNRVWTHTHASGSRAYQAQTTVPSSDIPANFEVVEEWQENFYDLFVEDLAYSVPMLAIHPDSLTAADSLSAYKKTASFRFNGQVRGQLSADFFQDGTNDQRFQVQRGLAGIQVELWNKGGFFPIAKGVTNAEGKYSFPYDVWKSQPLVAFYIKVRAYNPKHEIRGYVKYPFKKIHCENLGAELISYNTWLPGNTENLDFGSEELNIGVLRGVSQCFLAYEFVESQSSYNLVSGLNVAVLSALENQSGTFFWPNILCPNVPNAEIITQVNGAALGRPTIFLERNRDENTVWHEFGHFVMWNLQDFCWTELVTSTGSHSASGIENPRLAWTEGFASGMETITDLHYHYIDQESSFDRMTDYEGKRMHEGLNGYVAEYYLSMAMRDMFDGSQQVKECYAYESDPLKALQPTYKDLPDTSKTGTWQVHEDIYEFPLDVIFDAVALGSTVDAEGNGQISSSGEFFANLMHLVSCEDREAIKIIFDENLVGWGVLNNTAFAFSGLSADIIGRNGPQEVMDGTNENLEDLHTGFNWMLQGQGLTTAAVDFNPQNLDVRTLDATTGDFNVGISTCLIDPLTVANNASLLINDASAFNNWVLDQENNLANTHIEVSSYNSIKVAPGGHLQVGSTNQSAELEMLGNLRLEGSISVVDNSELIITDGAKLFLAPGHQIVLEGANSILRVIGQVVIEENSEFSFTGDGRIIFDASPIVSSDNLIFTYNSGFVLEGNGPNHIMAEIHQSILAASADHNALGPGNYIRITNGKVLLNDGASLRVSIPIEMENAVLDALHSGDTPNGLYLAGQEGIDISHSSFNNMRYGIRNLNAYGEVLELYGCEFNYCEYGLWQQGYTAELYGSDFSHCDYAVYTIGASLPGYVGGCTISDCNTGLLFFGNTTLHLNATSIHNNVDFGVDFYGRTFSSWCGDISDNFIGFQGICSEVVLSSKFKPYSGYMDFSGNRYGINMQGTNLRLNWGNNDLVSTDPLSTSNTNVFSRNVAWYATHSGLMSNTQILASGNKWDNDLSSTTNKPIYQSDPFVAPFGNHQMTVIEPFTGVLSPATVKSFSSISVRPSCPSLVSSDDVNGFVLVENEFHNPEHGTPELDLEPLTGTTDHEFQGMTLQSALSATLEGMYDEMESQRYTVAAGRLADIIRTADNSLWQYAPDEYVSYLLDYAYLRMMEAMEYACLYEGAIDNGSTALVDEVIDAQEALIAMVVAETNPNMEVYSTRFKYNLDLATTHWILRDHSNATATLNAMQLWTLGNELEIVNSTLCIIDYEKDLAEGILNLYNADESPYPCKVDFVLPDLRGEETTGLPIGQKNSTSLELFPNPASHTVQVRFVLSRPSAATFTIYNAKGQQVLDPTELQATKEGSFVLNTSSLSDGIYYVKAFAAGKEATTTFSVQQ